VDPTLTVGESPEIQIPLDAVCCQTVFAKSLGPISEWKQRLQVSHRSGYNFVHFTPIQVLTIVNKIPCLWYK